MGKKKKKKNNNPKSKKRRKPKHNQHKQALMRRATRAQRELPHIYRLLDNKEWDEARVLLEDLHIRYPKSVEVLQELVNLAFDTDDLRLYFKYIRKLAPFMPEEGDIALGLSGGYSANTYPFAAHHYKQEYLRNFPDHERAEEVRASLPDDEELLNGLLEDFGAEGKEGYELGYHHDLLRAEIAVGDEKTALQMGHQLLEKYPSFAPAYNNLSQLEFTEGNSETAINYARRVLELEPNNFQASANLARYLYLMGHIEEANVQGDHLESIQSDNMYEFWIKKAEAFTYLDRPKQVEAAVRGADGTPKLSKLPGMGLLYHFGAISALNMGKEDLARARWKQVDRRDPAFPITRMNLDDLKRPKHQRHGPIPFSKDIWLPANFSSDIEGMIIPHQKSKKSDSDKDDAIMQDFQTYFDEHPRLMHIFDSLLERGGKEGREVIFSMAHISEYPPLLEKMHQYALSQHGPDESRMDAVRLLQKYGYISTGIIRMWLEGEWEEMFVYGFEIGEESEFPFPITNREAHAAYIESFGLLREGKAREAEVLLKRANQLQPEHPIILNNLSLCYEQMDESDKSADVRREVFQKNPDYLFGQTSFVNQAVLDGDLEQAQEILNPLLQRKKLHFAEFSAVADSQLRILIARGEFEEAKNWIGMWRDISADDPELAIWEERMERIETKNASFVLGALRKLMTKS